MKKINFALVTLLITLVFIACQKEFNKVITDPQPPLNTALPIVADLQGNVKDSNGSGAKGVKITVGTKTTITNADGYFHIADAPLDQNTSLVTAELPGYFKAYRSFRATSGTNQVAIKLIRKVLTGTINATTGGEVFFGNGAKISLPANTVSDLTGKAYSDIIQVFAVYIDPTSENITHSIPGSFMADDKVNNRVSLSFFGLLAVELENAGGGRLQITPGTTAKLTVPVPPSLNAAAPANINLWYLQESTGVWKEQGIAKKTGDKYIAEVRHFSYWGCCTNEPSVNFSALFKSASGLALPNLYVRIMLATDTASCAFGWSDEFGAASGLVPANKSLVMEVRNECNALIISKNIGPFSEGTDIGTIVFTDDVSSVYTFKGRLVSCSNQPVQNGYAIVKVNNLSPYYASTNEKGEFLMNFPSCHQIPVSYTIIGVDNENQWGKELVVPVTSKLTDFGNVIACGNSAELINYTLDGVEYGFYRGLSSIGEDSILTFNNPAANNLFATEVSATYLGRSMLFAFTGINTAGEYPLTFLSINGYSQIRLNKPFNITITEYPQISGQFYIGSFSGSFVDSSNLAETHNISCSFRVKNN